MSVALAFYKGKGNWLDFIIRLVTRSQYSHVEYIQNHTEEFSATGIYEENECWTSSARDGGVRKKMIDVDTRDWEVVLIEFQTTDMRLFFECKAGAKYDYVGILFSQLFSFKRHSIEKWFCSEICAAALGFEEPQRFSPSTLKLFVEALNKA